MSMFGTVKTDIKDVKIFASVCEKENLIFDSHIQGKFPEQIDGKKVIAAITDPNPDRHYMSNYALLIQDGTKHSLYCDNDQRYNAITAKYGKNCGLLLRNYAEQVILKSLRSKALGVTRTVKEDGSVHLRVRVA